MIYVYNRIWNGHLLMYISSCSKKCYRHVHTHNQTTFWVFRCQRRLFHKWVITATSYLKSKGEVDAGCCKYHKSWFSAQFTVFTNIRLCSILQNYFIPESPIFLARAQAFLFLTDNISKVFSLNYFTFLFPSFIIVTIAAWM